MKWSWKIGEFKGIPVHIHITFLIIIAWLALASLSQGQGLAAVAGGLLFVASIFGCVLLHEFGHSLAARRFGIETRDITLLPIGGIARLERMPEEPRQELWVALAGPAVNVAIAGALFVWLKLTTGFELLSALTLTTGPFLERLLMINLFLAGFNLLPAFPMDGGRVLRALLALKLDHARATRFAAGLGQAMAFVFGFLGFFYNPFLLLIAFFVWIAAAQEARHAMMQSAFRGVPVPYAMVTDFKTLDSRDSLRSALDHMRSRSQHDFPVMDGDRLVGILTRERLLRSLAGGGERRTVGDAMGTNFQVIQASETLETALARLQDRGETTMPVLSGGRLVGLLTSENMDEYLLIRSALEKAGEAA
jgi:Zn-dependent protease/CBS domain-containing protein